MFLITEDPSSGRLVQCLAKNYKNDSIVSVDMDLHHIQNILISEQQITDTKSYVVLYYICFIFRFMLFWLLICL